MSNNNTEDLSLVEPSAGFQSEFQAMLAEQKAAGENLYLGILETAGRDFRLHLQRLQDIARGKGLPLGYVPMTTFWLVRDGAVLVGESRLRHTLTEALTHEGGHIGYHIRPSYRRKGYGTQILAMTLGQARMLGLKRALVTCDTDNVPSARIIEKNGGIFENRVTSHRTGKLVSRYWIEL